MKKHFPFLTFFLLTFAGWPDLYSQSISGPGTAIVGVAAEYSFFDDTMLTSPHWDVTNGSSSSWQSGYTYYNNISFTEAGTQTVAFYDGSTLRDQITVYVAVCPASSPSSAFTYSGNLTDVVITRTSSPPSGVSWYWQSVSTGQNTLSYGSTYNATPGSTYYLTAQDNASGCWSTGYQATAIIPSNTSVTPAERCSTGTLELSATVGTNGTTVRWYTASSGGSASATGTSYTTPSISSTTTYYACTYNATTGAEGRRFAVTATVHPTTVGGTAWSTADVIATRSGTLALTGHTGSVVRWEQNSTGSWTTISNTTTTQNYTNLAASTQYRAVVKSGTCSEANSVAIPIGILVVSYGNDTLLTATSGSSYQWYKNGSILSGQTSQTYTSVPTGVFSAKLNGNSSASNVFFVLPPLVDMQGVNASSTIRILKPGVTESTNLYTLAPAELSQAISYQDGLGRTFQTIAVNQAPGYKDIVAPAGAGRQGFTDTTYLPFVSTANDGRYRANALKGTNNTYASSEQYLFYQGTAKVASDGYPFARTIYRNTPDGRAIEQGAPGQDWQYGGSHTIKDTITWNNTTTLKVRLWKQDGKTSADYPANSVVVSIAADENGHRVRTFTNNLGQTVLKQVEESANGWLSTYTIYDDFGRMVYQLPPKAVVVLGTGTDANSSLLAELIYKYSYDARGRLTVKKVPGAAEQFIVYDIYDRVVLTQDGNLKNMGKWLFVKYDRYGRAVSSGLYTNAKSRALVQQWVDKAYNASSTPYPLSSFYEEKSSGTTHGYTNRSFPKDSTEYLSISYFDSYDFNENGTADYAYDNAHLSGSESAASTSTRGLATGSKRVTLNTSGNPTTTWLYSIVFYDTYDRPIQTLSNNHMYTTVADKATVTYDFPGKATKTRSSHNASATQRQTITARPEYDHAGRILKQYQSMDHPAEFSSPVGVSVNGSTVTKSAATSAFDAGAFSVNGIAASTNGALQFGVTGTAGAKMMGLSDTNPNVSYTNIDYAIYPKNGGSTIEVWENGANRGGFGSYTATDIFTIERTGTTIKYKKNGTTFYTSTVASSTALYADCSIYQNAVGFVNVTFIGQEKLLVQYEYNALGQVVDKKIHDTGGSTFLQSVDYRYNIRGWLKSINNAQLNSDALNDETNDVFGEEILYNIVESGMSNAAQFNGNISATKYKSFGTAGAADQRSYKYAYDFSDRLTEATFQANTGSAWTKEAGTLNETMTYDANGNILSLVRKRNIRGLETATPPIITSAPETIDNLTYTYASISSGTQNSNTLKKVEDNSGMAATTGFINGETAASEEYLYNSDGSMTKDKNKNIDSVHYNFLGKVRRVKFNNGDVIVYTYDATGSKLKMSVADTSGTAVTDYVGGYVYINSILSFFSSPEGRVVKNGGNYEYQYALADHLGNTRVIVSSVTPAPSAQIATFEGDAGDNSNLFTNVDASKVVSFTAANHTPGGSKVVKMNQTYPVGPSKSIKVYPGDQVDTEVWTYYENNTGFGTDSPNLAAMVTAIATAFGGASGGGGESGSIFDGVNTALGAFGLGGNEGNTAPAAYLNYILYDQGYKVLDMGWTVVPTAAYGSKQKITLPQLTIKEAGFVFVYLSYEDLSNNWVQFDDFKVTHTKSNLIQGNEYYPFGMQTANSWTRENVTGNRFLANGGTELNATSQLYDLEYRNFDPALGRMHSIDPMAVKYASLTPYNYSFNDPVSLNDPNGANPYEDAHAYWGSSYASDGYDEWTMYGSWATRYCWTGYINGVYTGNDVALNVGAFKPGAFSGKSGMNGIMGYGGEFSDWREGTFEGVRTIGEFLTSALNSEFGGSWRDGSTHMFGSSQEAFDAGVSYNNHHNSWGNTRGAQNGSAMDVVEKRGYSIFKNEQGAYKRMREMRSGLGTYGVVKGYTMKDGRTVVIGSRGPRSRSKDGVFELKLQGKWNQAERVVFAVKVVLKEWREVIIGLPNPSTSIGAFEPNPAPEHWREAYEKNLDIRYIHENGRVDDESNNLYFYVEHPFWPAFSPQPTHPWPTNPRPK